MAANIASVSSSVHNGVGELVFMNRLAGWQGSFSKRYQDLECTQRREIASVADLFLGWLPTLGRTHPSCSRERQGRIETQ
jgi:hypothetical protein